MAFRSKQKKNDTRKTAESIAVLIPMHNEEHAATRCVQSVINALKYIRYQHLLVVINDGSTDATEKILNALCKKYRRKLALLHHATNHGYGAALKSGMDYARHKGFTYALCMDSDGTNDPKYISTFADKIPQGYDCVKASRYIRGSKVIGVPRNRIWVSKVGNAIASALFHMGIRDYTNGFRMVRLASTKHIPYREPGFASILEELYFFKRFKARCMEIPTTLTARTSTKTHFRYTVHTLYSYLKYALYAVFT